MTGYQEISTDASYRGQIVVMTYPLIDNYGVNADDMESRRPWIAGMAVRELAPTHSNWRQQSNMHSFLAQHGIPGIQGIDTRALTRTLRIKGHKRGVLASCPGKRRQWHGSVYLDPRPGAPPQGLGQPSR